MLGLALGLSCLGGPTAVAQVPPGPPPAPPETLPLAQRTGWVPVGPIDEATFLDVAIHPTRPSVWAAIRDAGSVWVTLDNGQTWVQALQGDPSRLGRVSDDEQVLLDVQARVDEIVGDLPDADAIDQDDGLTDDELDALEELESATNAAADAAADVLGGVQTEVDGGQWLGDLPSAAEADGRPRVVFTTTGLLMVARGDGLHLSPDLGTSWSSVLNQPISDVAEVGPGQVLAVGPQGAWFSPDLVQWTPTPMPMAAPPYDLVVDGGTFAVGPDGVWLASNGLWEHLPGAGPHVPLTVRPTRASYDRGLVVATLNDLLRAESTTVPAQPVLGGPLPEVRDVERWQDDVLVAATSLGPYVSENGGRSWVLLDHGLDDPRVHAVEVVGGQVVLVGNAGIWRLEPRSPEPEAPAAPGGLQPFVPLGLLIDTASAREELRQSIGSRWAAALLPQVSMEYLTRRRVGPDWENNDPDGTALDLDGYWQARTVLTWTPGRQRTGTSFDAEGGGDDLPVVVVGREVVVDDGQAPQVLYSKVSRGATNYRGILAGRITEMYRLRARLLLEGEPRDLLRAVQRQLRIDELEASLDALTDGAVTRWRLDANNVP